MTCWELFVFFFQQIIYIYIYIYDIKYCYFYNIYLVRNENVKSVKIFLNLTKAKRSLQLQLNSKRGEREREIQSSAEQRGDRLIGSPFSLIDLAIRPPRSVSAGSLLRWPSFLSPLSLSYACAALCCFRHGDSVRAGGAWDGGPRGVHRDVDEREHDRQADPGEGPWEQQRQQRLLLSGPLRLPR